MNKQSIREIFDNISLSVISFLENHIGITDVEFTERQGVAESAITKREEENGPLAHAGSKTNTTTTHTTTITSIRTGATRKQKQ